jgi:uncharacterized protein YjbJ (UPF0337 family)
MNKDTVKGKMKEVEGRIQREAGELAGSKKEQLKGMAKQAQGKMQEGLGKMKDAGRNVIDRMPAPGKSKHEKDLPEEDDQDAQKRKGPASNVVPDRGDEEGEEVA